jgi:hypothetical protein
MGRVDPVQGRADPQGVGIGALDQQSATRAQHAPDLGQDLEQLPGREVLEQVKGGDGAAAAR